MQELQVRNLAFPCKVYLFGLVLFWNFTLLSAQSRNNMQTKKFKCDKNTEVQAYVCAGGCPNEYVYITTNNN